jgi:hypothetical protein
MWKLSNGSRAMAKVLGDQLVDLLAAIGQRFSARRCIIRVGIPAVPIDESDMISSSDDKGLAPAFLS